MTRKVNVIIEYPADADASEYKKLIGKVLIAIIPKLRKMRADGSVKTAVRRARADESTP